MKSDIVKEKKDELKKNVEVNMAKLRDNCENKNARDLFVKLESHFQIFAKRKIIEREYDIRVRTSLHARFIGDLVRVNMFSHMCDTI